MALSIKVPAATAIVDYDLMRSATPGFAQTSTPRKLVSASLVGSTAIGDTKVDILVGQRTVANLFNTVAGASKIPVDSDKKWINAEIPVNAQLAAIVRDAADTQDIVLELDIREVQPRSYGRGGRFGKNYSIVYVNGVKMIRRSNGQLVPARF